MDDMVSYVSLFAILLVVVLLVWSLVLTYKDKRRRTVTAAKRLAQLRRKIEALPEKTDEEKARKDALFRELSFEYFENILGGIDSIKSTSAKKPEKKKEKKSTKKKKRAKK
jgi:flagellar biosynthesis/type III secretory pathway M-ring protein FliF/YscJ